MGSGTGRLSPMKNLLVWASRGLRPEIYTQIFFLLYTNYYIQKFKNKINNFQKLFQNFLTRDYMQINKNI